MKYKNTLFVSIFTLSSLLISGCEIISDKLSSFQKKYVVNDSYQITCYEQDTGFTINYLINSKNRSIKYINSFSTITKQSFAGEEEYRIIDWRNDGYVLAFRNSPTDGMPNVFLFNLNIPSQKFVGFYDGDVPPYISSRICFEAKDK